MRHILTHAHVYRAYIRTYICTLVCLRLVVDFSMIPVFNYFLYTFLMNNRTITGTSDIFRQRLLVLKQTLHAGHDVDAFPNQCI